MSFGSVVYQSVKLWIIHYRSVNNELVGWYDAVMARPREFDTKEAIASICDQFWSDGYEATGIADLESATGLARARLYSAFGSKQGMLYEAIDFYLESRVGVIFKGVDGGGVEGVASFFRRFGGIVAEHPDRAEMGCLVVNSMIEFGRSEPGLVERADRYRERVRGAFRSALGRDADEGRLLGEVEELADLAYVMLMGLYVTVKGGAPLEEINRLCGIAIGVVESWRVEAA